MSLTTFAQTHPRLFDAGIHLDRAPAAAWLGLQAAALAPTWWWMACRMHDGSDDPLGLLAIGALALLAWSHRRELRAAPRLGWFAIAALGTLAATLLRTGAGPLPALPPLAAGLIAVLAIAAALLATLPRRVAAWPVVGLAVLALPLLSSLQFYAGYPLRVITAEASRWLLAPGFDVAREGSSLLVDGQLVIVDAPCSGVQMAWLGYFTACAVALWARRSDRAFLLRLPAVGVLVMAGNIVRNSVLVALEGAGHTPAPWLHEALGLLTLAFVCGGIAWVMTTSRKKPMAGTRPRPFDLARARAA
ncbi:exosortase Q [Variovorax sp. J22R133]|uniref:exosortase Q n=1 Tax=Variovorax brevis TaxID=3053503 RepID=UPI0025785A6E|nr:exosortase Q [Variovorax sp. J22R133]MDM0111706.1 exosortase Q [Variovorax sp. J22R133]